MENSNFDRLIAELGRTFLTKGISQFENDAKEKSEDLTLSEKDLVHLKNKLYDPPESFPRTPIEKLRLGQWMAVCQYVIFEILFHSRPVKIEFLKKIAFGEYDWTQATALEVLTRLAIDKEISGDILNEINADLGNMRYETHLYFGKSLITRSQRDHRFSELLSFFSDKNFQEALEEVK